MKKRHSHEQIVANLRQTNHFACELRLICGVAGR